MRGTNSRKTQASGAQGRPRHGSTRLPGEHPGLTLAAAFAAGCHLGSALPVGSRLGLTAGAVLAVWLVMQSVFPKRPGGRWRGYVWVALFAAVGCLRGSAVHGERDAPEVFDRSPRRLRGRVDSVPIRRPPRSTLPGRTSERLLFTLRLAGSRGVPESIAVAVDLPSGTSTPPPPAGALVELRGSFLPPRGPGNPGEVGSSSPLFFIPCPEGVRVLDPSAPSGWRGLLLGARERVQGLLHRLYSAEIRGLMISLLLGDRRLLSENIRHALTETGTYHFLAISGLHVGIFLVVLLRLPIPAGARTFGRLFALAAFSLLAGGATPVVRASLMAGLHLLLRRLGRSPHPLNTLGWTALVILGADPSELHELGFQLSFVAVFAIVRGRRPRGDPLVSRVRRLRRLQEEQRPARRLAGALWRIVGSSLRVSVTTSLVTAPLILYSFGRIHPLGPLWTVGVYPLAVVVLAGGLASVVLGLASVPLGELVAVPTEWAARGMTGGLALASEVPASCVYLPAPEPWQVVAAYLLMLGAGRLGERRLLFPVVALGVLGASLAALRPTPPEIWHFDVGQGNATLLRLPGGGDFLIDAGGRGPRAGERLLRAVLRAGSGRLSGVFLSHPHDDHVGALARLVDSLPVDSLWTSRHFASFGPGRRLLRDLQESGVRHGELARGDVLVYPGDPPVALEVLYPPRRESLPVSRSANDTSLVLRVRIDRSRLLCLGDLQEGGLSRLMSGDDDLSAGILLLPHHGRANRLLPELLRRVEPHTVIISGSGAPASRRTARELERRGYAVYSTWRGGAVLSTWRDGRWSTRQPNAPGATAYSP